MWFVFALFLACEPENPCDDYVDYMCTCHDGAGTASGTTAATGTAEGCDELRLTYQDAGPDVQDECVVLLDEQQQEDDDAGLDCAI